MRCEVCGAAWIVQAVHFRMQKRAESGWRKLEYCDNEKCDLSLEAAVARLERKKAK